MFIKEGAKGAIIAVAPTFFINFLLEMLMIYNYFKSENSCQNINQIEIIAMQKFNII